MHADFYRRHQMSSYSSHQNKHDLCSGETIKFSPNTSQVDLNSNLNLDRRLHLSPKTHANPYVIN